MTVDGMTLQAERSTRATVLDWLADPPDARVVETHTSLLVFTGARVFKVKKALDLGFSDFTTPEARRAACEAEVALNRRLAPDVYLGVVPVTGPDGEAVDSAVVMRRMRDDRRLSALLRRGHDVHAALRAVARLVAGFHSRAETSDEITRFGSPEFVRGLWDEGVAGVRPFAGTVLPRDVVDEIEHLAGRFLDGRGALLRDRQRAGHIRDGHGDLLADDIFCLDDGPRILDCLEFDRRLRLGDVLADTAFLAMDLERLGAPELATAFLRDYAEFSGESHPPALADFYIAYRAFVRCKVACLRTTQLTGNEATSASATARRLATLAVEHLRRARVRLVLIGGLPGTGKTTLATAVAAHADGWIHLRSDVVRKELAGLPATRSNPEDYQPGLYNPEMTDRTYAELLARARVALGRGETVVLDATWSDGRHRAAAAALADETAADLVQLRATLSPVVAATRIERRAAAGGDASDASVAVLRAMSASFDPWPEAVTISSGVPRSESLRAALGAVVRPVKGLP